MLWQTSESSPSKFPPASQFAQRIRCANSLIRCADSLIRCANSLNSLCELQFAEPLLDVSQTPNLHLQSACVCWSYSVLPPLPFQRRHSIRRFIASLSKIMGQQPQRTAITSSLSTPWAQDKSQYISNPTIYLALSAFGRIKRSTTRLIRISS